MESAPLEVWRILMIDDDEDDYLITRSMLRQTQGRGVEIQWAQTYRIGQQCLESNHYHAVLVDYDLGARTGIELIQETVSRGYAAPLILFTGRGSYETDIEAMQAGATMYLTKAEATPLLLERSLRYAIERKRIEEELRTARAQSENESRRLEAVMEALPVGVAITNAKGDQIHANSAYEKVWSGPQPEVKTVSDYAAYRAWWVDTGEPLAADEWASAQAVQKGEAVIGQTLQIQRFDGSHAFVINSASPVRSSTGEVIGSAVAIQDITTLREVEQALRESEEQLRLAHEAGDLGTWRYDLLAGRLHFDERARLHYGLDTGTVSLEAILARVHPDDVERLKQDIVSANDPASEGRYATEYRVIHPDGEIRWLAVQARIYFEGEDESPHAVLVVGTSQDVTARKQVEQALRESQTDLNRAQAVAQTGSWRLNVRRDELLWSDETYRIFGIPKGSPQSYETFLASIHPEDREFVDRSWSAALRGEPYDIEHRIVVGEELKWVRERAELEFDRQGNLLGGFGTVQDITERKRMEDELRGQALFPEENPNPVMRLSPDGTLLYANSSSKWLLERWKRDSSTGFPAKILLTLAEVLRCGSAKEVDVECDEKIFSFVLSPIQSQDYVNLYGRDITERKQIEHSLRKLSQAIEQSPVSVVITDIHGTIEYVNPKFSRLTGYTFEEAYGNNPRILQSGQTPAHIYQHLWETIMAGSQWQGEFCNRKKNGELYWESASISPIVDENGAITHFVAVKEDITGRKKAEDALRDYAEKLESSNQVLQDFAFVASHDLQEPLRKIQAFGEILKSQHCQALDEQGKSYVDRMQVSARRMRSMLDGLLAYSRVTTQGQPFTQVDLAQITADILSDLELRMMQTGGQVYLDSLPVIEADPVQIRQLLQNLVGNALKFHRPGVPPQINISFRPASGDTIQLVVEDNGIGFDMLLAGQLFQPFRRLHPKSEYEGTGMGLAICRKIVERHGGQIDARSGSGLGATFIVTLPISQKAE